MIVRGMGRLLMVGAMLILAACSSGGNSGGTVSSSASTVQVKGTVNTGEIGGTGLTVFSAQQETTAPLQGGSYTTTISTSGPQLLFVQDANEVVRGLTFTLKPSTSSQATPTVVPVDATSTALALLLLSPGVTPPDWSFAQPVVTALQSLTSFPAFVTFMQSNLPAKSLPEVIADSAYETLLGACLAEWPTKAATITPLPSSGTSAAAFAVAPKISPEVAPPAQETGGVVVKIEDGYTGPNDIRATLTNYSLRSVALYEFSDPTGTGSSLTLTGPSEWFRGGEGPNSLSIFGAQSKGIVPRRISKSITFPNPNAKVHYYVAGPGFAASAVVPPPEVGGFDDLWIPVGYDISKYVVAPALSFIFGLPISDIVDTVITGLDGLNDPDPAIADLKKQLVKVSTETVLSAQSVLAYRVLLKEYGKLALGKFGPLIKGGTRGFLSSVIRIGTIYDAANFIFYVDDLIQLPRYAKVEVASPYDTVQFNAPTYIVKKTDGRATLEVTRTDGSNDVLEVKYTVTPVTAIDGQDYSDTFSPTPGFLRFNPGQTTAAITLRIIDNPVNTGARRATVALGAITGLGKLGPQSAVSLTIGLAVAVNSCEADVPTYAPSGCEMPRIVAKNPYTPLQAGQAVPFSELVEYRPGTCAEITDMQFWFFLSSVPNVSLVGVNPRPNPGGSVAAFTFLSNPNLSDNNKGQAPSSVTLQSTVPADPRINIPFSVAYYSGPWEPPLIHGFTCSFTQAANSP